jgi:hypothetical protein
VKIKAYNALSFPGQFPDEGAAEDFLMCPSVFMTAGESESSVFDVGKSEHLFWLSLSRQNRHVSTIEHLP